MIRCMRIDGGRVGPELVAEERSPGAPEGTDWDAVVEISSYILSVGRDGYPEIALQTAEMRGAGVATLSFRAAVEGSPISLSSGSGTNVWPSDAHLIWIMPPAAFDAVLAILRDGEPPSLHAFTREGEIHCTLAGETKTRAAT